MSNKSIYKLRPLNIYILVKILYVLEIYAVRKTIVNNILCNCLYYHFLGNEEMFLKISFKIS